MLKTKNEKIPELVILVDDDHSNVRAVNYVLSELGFRVIHFSNTAAAMPIVATRHVDLVITEHELHDIDGVALSAHARAAWGDARPAFIAMTRSHAVSEHSFYDAVLTKPVRVTELMDAVDDAIALRAPYRTGARLRRQA
jgi:DNA-binding response OmpR family regulator